MSVNHRIFERNLRSTACCRACLFEGRYIPPSRGAAKIWARMTRWPCVRRRCAVDPSYTYARRREMPLNSNAYGVCAGEKETDRHCLVGIAHGCHRWRSWGCTTGCVGWSFFRFGKTSDVLSHPVNWSGSNAENQRVRRSNPWTGRVQRRSKVHTECSAGYETYSSTDLKSDKDTR